MPRLIDLSGQSFGGITVKSRCGQDSTGKTTWNCTCHCGADFVATGLNLKSNNTKSCGCHRNRPQRLDITGARYSRLTAVKVEKASGGKVWWRCACDCGAETVVSYAHLSSGHTTSCGCLRSEISSVLAKANLGGVRETHPRWRPELSDEDREKERPNQPKWSRAVMERDGFTCQKCGCGGRMHAHHLIGFAANKELRNEISNGVTLCEECHLTFHKKYGQRDFTRANYFEWVGITDPECVVGA